MADDDSKRTPEDGHTVRGQETLFKGSITDEKHPEVTPQNPSDFAGKMKAESDEHEGLVGKAKKLVKEVDRDLGGEYQRREDPTAPPAVRDEAD